MAQNIVEKQRYAWEWRLGFSLDFARIPREGLPIYTGFAPRSCVAMIQPRIYLQSEFEPMLVGIWWIFQSGMNAPAWSCLHEDNELDSGSNLPLGCCWGPCKKQSGRRLGLCWARRKNRKGKERRGRLGWGLGFSSNLIRK
jgi:hypothetical protein